jgi:hypothetical protein
MIFFNDQFSASSRKIENPSNVATHGKSQGAFQKNSSQIISGEKNQETSIQDQADKESLALLEKFFGKKMVNKYEKKF